MLGSFGVSCGCYVGIHVTQVVGLFFALAHDLLVSHPAPLAGHPLVPDTPATALSGTRGGVLGTLQQR